MNAPSTFERLLAAAAAQPQPQLLLFVFAAAELPGDATAAQRARFERGAGGALTPLMCVEKPLHELTSFEALAAEARANGPPWQVMFAAALSGRDGHPPSAEEADSALRTLVDRVQRGAVDGLLALSHSGEMLALS